MLRTSRFDPGARVGWALSFWLLLVAALFAEPAAALVLSSTAVTVPVGGSTTVTISSARGEIQAESRNTAIVTVALSNRTKTGATLTLLGRSAGSATVYVRDARTANVSLPVTVVTSTSTSSAKFTLIAWNDLGMHCMDGVDYSVFSILPPYNNLNAQLVNASTGKPVTSGVTLTYQSVADASGSINTSSAGKTDFWAWVHTIYGAAPAPNVGLTGNMTPSLTPRAMTYNATHGWFEATGLPITPYDDQGAKNFYPMVKVIAKDGTGKVLASTSTVLPVSDEITCAACHASRPATETNTARLAAKPAHGWVYDANAERDWKKNILRLHDERQAANPAYQSALLAIGRSPGLYTAALSGQPTLCAACHASNALPGTGVGGVSTLTSALHTNHGRAVDPGTMTTLDSSNNRQACYLCHPGSVTRCLRGAMGNAMNPDGTAAMGCQSCHGNMTNVGNPARVGWLEEPTCQACHFNGKRTLSAVDASGNPIVVADTRFATNPNVPAAGFSLYRFSKGHGRLQCEACHGATHAEYPSSHANDNVQSIALQGYAGTIRECKVCHASPPLSASGGPHGLHTIGAAWVDKHGDYVESSGPAQCAYCHGSDYRGGPLAQVKAARTYKTKNDSSRTYAAGQNVGCYDCHNGPNP